MKQKPTEEYMKRARDYWREEGYEKQAVWCIAELMQRVDELEKQLDEYKAKYPESV